MIVLAFVPLVPPVDVMDGGATTRGFIEFGLILAGVAAARRDRNLHIEAGILGGFFDCCAAADHDHIGERNAFAEVLLDRFELR